MGKPVLTMSRSYDASGALRGSSQCHRGTGSHRANALFDQSPGGFDGIEVVGVGRQETQRGPRLFDQLADLRRFVSGQIVHHHDIPGAQVWHEVTADPADEARTVHRPPGRGEGEPLVYSDRPDHRQVVAPVDGARFDEHFAARQPGMRAAHREIRARFIEKDQPSRVYPLAPALEGQTFGLDRGPIQFRGPRPFFLNTNPVRCRARKMLDRCTRASGAARRLYSRVTSSVVRSGRSRTSRWSSGMSTGEYQPPPLGAGITWPVSRACRTHSHKVLTAIANRSATSTYVSVLSSYARTARSRNSIGYGFGMQAVDHDRIPNSTEFWG